MLEARQFLRSLFDAAVAAAKPEHCMQRWLPPKPAGRVFVVGAGKAAAAMAQQLENYWGGALEGTVIVPHGYAENCSGVQVVEAAHPVPDETGLAATRSILEHVTALSADDTVACLLSGGGSSLLSLPAGGVTLREKQSITAQLLRSGAAIHEINCVRKKLSGIKGGKLAAACSPARVISMIISDVPGNDVSMVASGPTIADTSSVADALQILDRFQISVSNAARAAITACRPVSIDDGDIRILATSDDALLAASALAGERDVPAYSLGDLSGDARELARRHAELAQQIAAGNGPLPAPCVLISGGETTVDVQGKGRGGRNGEYALSLAIALNGHPAIHALAGDTDGIDGTEDNAGCFVSPDVLNRAAALGLDANEMQSHNDSYGFFSGTLDLIVTGPTRTNVNDFRAILISGEED